MEFLKIDEDGSLEQVKGREPTEEEKDYVLQGYGHLIRFRGNTFEWWDNDNNRNTEWGWHAVEEVK